MRARMKTRLLIEEIAAKALGDARRAGLTKEKDLLLVVSRHLIDDPRLSIRQRTVSHLTGSVCDE